MTTSSSVRSVLGDFGSIVCFKAIITGVEDTLGPDGAAVVFVRAGRVRGQQLATQLGLRGSHLPIEQLAVALDEALGVNGTRLCRIERAYTQGEDVVIEAKETLCTAGEPQGSERLCTFTLGAVWGALEAVTGRSYLGRHTHSVLRGAHADVFTFTPR
ncbi:putative hydrocarbon binding protein [Deinobacterium chartae]|uniref:Putative hydrocarbon binding protein n=1 Tax=Deinobacterium chartae TaxID=521158 RepID=A0A841I269_9DEIO|nr:hypothetical protein [Deinobacterium chartae]MBB6098479.1 putative hydrocarbon binding protein [Deinobacterium chartae]